jgi:hypothetical protein
VVSPDFTRAFQLRQQCIVPTSSRRHQQPRHLHSCDGLHNIRPAFHDDRGTQRTIQARVAGHHFQQRQRYHHLGARTALAGTILPEHQLREPNLRSGGLLWLQIRRCHCHYCNRCHFQRRQGNRRLGGMDCVRLHFHGERILPGKSA